MEFEPLLGKFLKPFRPGMKATVSRRAELATIPATIEVGSESFSDGGFMPKRCSAEGHNVFPSLFWKKLSTETASLVVLVEDVDVPWPRPLVHACVYNITPALNELPAGAIPPPESADRKPHPAYSVGKNSFGKTAYLGPMPPRGHGPHRYVFEVFALKGRLEFATPPGRKELLAAMRGKVLAKGELIGRYERA